MNVVGGSLDLSERSEVTVDRAFTTSTEYVPQQIGKLSEAMRVVRETKLVCPTTYEMCVKPVFHGACFEADSAPILYAPYTRRVRPCLARIKPGVHTNDFAPIHRRRALKLGHASLATVFRPGRLTFQQIPQENLESPLLRYQPITTAVITEACLNTRWHHGAYTPAALRESLDVDRVVV